MSCALRSKLLTEKAFCHILCAKLLITGCKLLVFDGANALRSAEIAFAKRRAWLPV